MGVFQNVISQRAEAFGPVGSRYGDGHKPSRAFHAALPVAQVDSVTFVDNDDITVFTLTVDGFSMQLAAQAWATATAIANAMIALVNAHPQVSQIVRPHLFAAGVMHLTARVKGTAFTATAAATVGTSTMTRAAVTANNAGVSLSPGSPVFRAASGSDAGLLRLPGAVTDVFMGVVPFRHEDAELESTPTGYSYPAGSIVPVDPDGWHVVTCATACAPGDPVYVTMTTGALRNSGTGAQTTRVTATAATNATVYVITIRFLDDGSTYTASYTSDGSATVTEIRDGLEAYLESHYGSLFVGTDSSTDAIDIAGPAGRPFEIIESNAELTVATQTAAGSFLLPGARWESVGTAGNKALMSHSVP